jgi:hypothetical protein
MHRLLVAAALVAAPALAQNCKYVPDSALSGAACNVIPFGTTKTTPTWANQRYQTIATVAQLGNLPGTIQELGFIPCGGGPRSFDLLEIKMGYTALNDFTTSMTFDSNWSGTPTVVLSAKNYVWNNTAIQWNKIGLQKPFIYLPPRGNVLIEILCMGSDHTGSAGFYRSATTPRLYATNWTGTPPASGSTDLAGLKVELCVEVASLDVFGKSCAISSGTPAHSYSGSSKVGNNVILSLTGALPTRPQILLLGLSHLPAIDLTGAGAPGCTLYVAPDVPLVAVSNASGSASATLGIPNDTGLLGVKVWSQYVALDPAANKLGAGLTNFGRILIGSGP